MCLSGEKVRKWCMHALAAFSKCDTGILSEETTLVASVTANGAEFGGPSSLGMWDGDKVEDRIERPLRYSHLVHAAASSNDRLLEEQGSKCEANQRKIVHRESVCLRKEGPCQITSIDEAGAV